jgi:metalloendopeptidase OMA1, mitochondrial
MAHTCVARPGTFSHATGRSAQSWTWSVAHSGPTGTRRVTLMLVLAALALPMGCDSISPGGQGEGPGHRSQVLALTPEQELELGREAYREILENAPVLPDNHPEVRRLRNVGERLVRATTIRPLMREINLRMEGYRFEWEFNVIASDRLNALCLPAGKVAVFTGLLRIVESDDELAAVVGHEIAHALAHHASERLAWNPPDAEALRAAGMSLSNLTASQRGRLIGLLSAGASLDSLAYNRFQESEADHIGVFLMTFAGYDPEAAIRFWERMREYTAGAIRVPEFLSDHPADARRIAQLRGWVPLALAGKKAYDEGRIAPEASRRRPVPGSQESTAQARDRPLEETFSRAGSWHQFR